MSWWIVLIIVVAAVIVTNVIAYFLMRRHAAALDAVSKIAETRVETAKKSFEVEREICDQLSEQNKKTTVELRNIESWHKDARQKIEEDKHNVHESLANNSDALDRKLDELLATDSTEKNESVD